MNSMIVIAAIALLVLLFLKVPVFVSVLSASAIYFLGNPTINATVFAQQTLAGAQDCPFWQFRSSSWLVCS